MNELRGKVAVIGGGSKGLGRGCAIELAKNGVNIVLCARGKGKLDVTSAELKALGVEVHALSVDMSSSLDNQHVISETIKRFGRLDILVNNSGGPPAGTFKEFSEDDWLNAFHSVLMYSIRMTTYAVPHMKQNGWGRIINIASLSAKEPAESLVLSNVFRAGIIGFSKSISKELIKSHITINTICPGAFKTDRAVELIKKAATDSGKSPAEVEEENMKKLPLGRYQVPEELGAYVAFLSSEIAGGITGTTVQIDGGISNGLL